MSCLVCGGDSEIHHIYSRKAYPIFKHADWNHMPLCRTHHVEIHKTGRSTFIKKHSLEAWLDERGWVYDLTFNKWLHKTK